ncbi:hypothetical protein N9Y42_10400 [Mariniblastus sp.]|nr:hypothetical protein [Mariniblastus sp.]
MNVLIDISIAILSAIIGAVVSYAIPNLARKRKNLRREDIIGDWHSSYLHYQHESTSKNWIDDKVSIAVDGSFFRFTCEDNPLGDVYEAKAELKNSELIGEWHSTKCDGGHANGSLLLTVLPMGGLLYGVFTGPRDNGERVFGTWVLGKTPEDVDKGKNLVATQVLRVPSTKRKKTQV